MKKEYDFSHAKRAKFGRLPPKEDLSRHIKVRITIMLDHDVVQFFKASAAKSGAEPYQTQINRALREYIAAGHAGGKEDLLDNEGFISRLAERVSKYSTGKRARRPS